MREIERRQISNSAPDDRGGSSSVRSRSSPVNDKHIQAEAARHLFSADQPGSRRQKEVSRIEDMDKVVPANKSNRTSSTSAGARGGAAGGGSVPSGGYLNQHLQDEEEDRRIMELEREVANLEALAMGASGRGKMSGVEKPRAVSATPSQRRTGGSGENASNRTPVSGRGAGGGTPSSAVSSKRAVSAGRPSRPTKKLSNAQQVGFHVTLIRTVLLLYGMIGYLLVDMADQECPGSCVLGWIASECYSRGDVGSHRPLCGEIYILTFPFSFDCS